MKYLIIHGEGFADGGQSAFGGKSLLEVAHTPHMDRLSRLGEFGWVSIPPEGLAPPGELTGLTILGYDPKKYSTGPAPLEAVGLGISVGEHDVVYRCQFVTLRSEHAPAGKHANTDAKKLSPLTVLEDATAGGIDTEEARELVEALNEGIGSETIQFYPGSGHQHYMVWANGKSRAVCANPQMVQGHPIGESLPNGDGADLLRKLMDAALVVLRDHPINLDRRDAGQKTATGVWLWGQGRSAQWPPLTEKLGISGAMVSLNTLQRGLGISAGFESVEPEGDTTGVDLLKPLAQGALGELAKKDFVYVHANLCTLVAPEAGVQARTEAVEAFDREIVGPLAQALAKGGPGRLLLVCDRSDALPGNGQANGQVLTTLVDSTQTAERSPGAAFDEAHATGAGGAAREGLKLHARFTRK